MSTPDLLIVVCYLVGAVVWGVWPHSRTTAAGDRFGDYLLGNRSVAWPLLLLSIVATETSTVTFLSLPGSSFSEGGDLTFLQITLGYVVGRLLVIWLLLPTYFRGEIFTPYELLEKRLGPQARVVASVLFLVCRTLSDGLRLFLTGLALELMLGWPFAACVGALVLVTAIYAVAGGVRSVVWNDAVQLIVYTTGALVAAWVLAQSVPGGFDGIIRFGTETGRWRWFDADLGLTGRSVTFWSGLVGGAFLSIATHGVDHLMVQRYLCAGSRRNAAIALGLSGPIVAAQFLLFLTIGVGLAAHAATLTDAPPLRGDQAFAHFLATETPTGVRGLMCAAVLAAGMSTLSSSLNASAGVLVNDILRLGNRSADSDGSISAVFWARVATGLFAVAQAAVAFLAVALLDPRASVIGVVLAIAGFTTGVVAGLFVLGAFARDPSPAVATAALIAGAVQGVVMISWNSAVDGGYVDGPVVNPWWNSLLAVTVTVGAGWIAVNATRRRATAAVSVLATLLAAASCSAGGLPLADPSQLGMRSKHLDQIPELAEAAHGEGQFAGCVVAVGRGDRLAMLWAHGDRQIEPERLPMEVDTVFDLASLTKPIATATSVFHLLERGLLRLPDRIDRHLPITAVESRRISVEMLLTHRSGYVPDNALEDYRHGVDEAWRRIYGLKPQHPPGTRFQYSDVNFELLGKLVELKSDTTLNAYAQRHVFQPLGMLETVFNPAATLQSRAAASEPRDGRMLIGVVHDPRAALLGGVAGHAGLFSTAPDLARYAAMMLGGGSLDGARILGPATVRAMTRPRPIGDVYRTAGWDSRSSYSSNRGDLLSDAAFGHGGFTGTAIWIDPELNLFVIFLSNRLHPDGVGSVNDLVGRICAVAAASIESL